MRLARMAIACLPFAVGCAMLAGIDGDYRVTGPDDAGADATIPDGDVWPRILDPGFEEAVSGSVCGTDWRTLGGRASRVADVGREGGACKLCLRPGEEKSDIAHIAQGTARRYPLGTYDVSAEFHAAPDASPFSECYAQIVLTPSATPPHKGNEVRPPGTEWRSSTAHAVYDGGPSLEVELSCLGVQAANGDAGVDVCAIVDDVVLKYSPPR